MHKRYKVRPLSEILPPEKPKHYDRRTGAEVEADVMRTLWRLAEDQDGKGAKKR